MAYYHTGVRTVPQETYYRMDEFSPPPEYLEVMFVFYLYLHHKKKLYITLLDKNPVIIRDESVLGYSAF